MNFIRFALPALLSFPCFSKAQPPFLNTADSSLTVYKTGNPSFNEEMIPNAEGELKGYHQNGAVHYLGRASKGKLTGEWKSWYANNIPCDSGTFIKGIPDGTWNVWHPDGTLRFVRTYSYNQWQRYKTERLRYNPKTVTSPLVRLYHTDRHKVNQHLSVLHSFCFTSSCDRPAEEKILQRLSHNAMSDHYHPLFGQALLHGLYINYFPGGVVKDSGYYDRGLPHGVWHHLDEGEGTRWSGFYRHGSKHKEWKLYSADGKLLRIIKYENGKEIWQKEINPPSPAGQKRDS